MLAKIKKIVSNRYFLMSIVALAAIISSWQFAKSNSLPGPVVSDGFYYDDIAMNILEGRGIITTWDLWIYAFMRLPAYPIFLSLIYLFFGHNILAVIISQFILSILACLFIYLTAEKIFNKAVAFFTAVFISVYPIYLDFNLYLMREASFIFLFVIFSYFIFKSLDDPAWKNFSLTGLLFGLAVLNRPVISSALPLILLWFLAIFRKNRKLFFRILVGCGFIPVLMVAIWLARGKILIGAPAMEYPGTMATWAYMTGRTAEFERDNPNVNPEILWNNPYAGEGERIKKLSGEAFRGMLADPLGLIKIGAHNLFTAHCFSGTCSRLWEPFLMILGFIGLSFGLVFLPQKTIYFLICILAIAVPSAIFGGSTSRFRNPLDWIYIMYGVFFIYIFVKSLAGRKKLIDLAEGGGFGRVELNKSKIFKYIRRGSVAAASAIIVFGLSKIGYSNAFCKSVPLSGLSSGEAEKILIDNKFAAKRGAKNWESFANIKNYLFQHQMNLGDYRGALISWTGIVRNPIYAAQNQRMDETLALRADNLHPFRSTLFNFIVSSSACSLDGGNFYAIFPGNLPKNFQDGNVVILGQLKQNDTIADRFGIHVIAVLGLDNEGRPDFSRLVFAEDIASIKKQTDFYK